MRKKITKNKKFNYKLPLATIIISLFLVAFTQKDSVVTNSLDLKFLELDSIFEEDFNNFEVKSITHNLAEKFKFEHRGVASYYAHRFHGNRTANGERFNMYDYTAAHRSLPFGTILKVTNIENNKSTFVRINDRGPFSGGRIIDLSKRAAEDINITGTQKVKLEGFKQGSKKLSISNKINYFGYSLVRDLVLVSHESVKLLDSSDYFSQAVRTYNSTFQKSTDKNLFIFIRADKQHTSNASSKDFKYYVGTLKESIILEETTEMAQK